MTCVIVNDASCLIDFRKGGLLGVVCDLPYRFVIPYTVRTFEVLDFSEADWRALDRAGMITHDLTAEEVGKALAVRKSHPGLSANDGFCLATAEAYAGILLTGDALLRRVARLHDIQVHGVLWAVDELEAAAVCSRSVLRRALEAWQSDETVFLPPDEIATRLAYLAKAGPRRTRRR